MNVDKFMGSAMGFTKSPLGIIALFIVLVYAIASLVVTFGNNIQDHVSLLIYFMITFPFVVFFGFLWLVGWHHQKLYGPSDFKNEENYLKTQLVAVASLSIAMTKDGKEKTNTPIFQLNEIVDLVLQNPHKESSARAWKNRILWVDDRPENNVYERTAFEAQGIKFSLSLSTDDALFELEHNKFSVIISDMGRKEGDNEGYVLLEKIRQKNIRTPFIIYASSNLPEHKLMARERGAIGSTNRADELYQLVMSVITSSND
ncbi:MULTISPECIES: response regulator [Pectobacterium]|uniref:response regulator n=1 Tax=Pectobacterium TaxID=122277 RepID=UPI000E235FB2|nr:MULTISPECIES: response regulator [Pectobacterium]MBQ4791829.1 response regulator [Pectobacterium versatile]RRO01294.1 response regulator [Pectobacterium aquaticum]